MKRWQIIVFGALVALSQHCEIVRGQPAVSTDWPHLRGPNYDGISPETGLASEWPHEGPPIVWRRELGEGYSGLVVVGDRVFTQLQSRTGQFLICLDARTGDEIWRTRIDWPWQPAGAYPGPYATPTWYAGRLYYATPSGLVGCVETSDGGSLWSVNVIKKFEGKGTEFGYASTPLVEQGKVILPVGGRGAGVVALNAADGSTAWAAGDDPASYCPAYPIDFRGRRLVIAFLRNSLAAHDLATGHQVWRQAMSVGYDEHSAWPLYAEPHLLITAPFRAGSRVYRLEESETGMAAQSVWTNRHLSNDVCSSVLFDGHIYGFDVHQPQTSPHRSTRGRFKCLDFATGAVNWETDKVGQASALVADGKLVLLNDTGTLILARANPAAYEELARAQVLEDGLCWTAPSLSRGRLFVRNRTHAACVFLGAPELLDRAIVPPQAQTAASRFDWSQLLSREPNYPHDPPAPTDILLWFIWCAVGVFGVALVVSCITAVMARAVGIGRWILISKSVFVIAALLLGMIGTTVFSAWANTFILTWPASLYVAFRLTLGVVTWAERQPIKTRPRWMARAAMAIFLAVCFGYYKLCLAVGYAMAWGFLGGFFPAAPAAIAAARLRNPWLRAISDMIGFAIYFWVSAMLPTWKDHF